MLAHRLKHIIHFQAPVNTQDPDTGANTVSWVTATLSDGTELDEVRAEVLLGPGREGLAAGAEHAQVDARINLRWFPGLQPTWRILWDDTGEAVLDSNGNWDGKLFDITSIVTDATGREEYRLTCTHGLTQGE